MNHSTRTFATLLRREWLQHRRVWLLIVAIPPALGLLVMLSGQINIKLGDEEQTLRFAQASALALTLGSFAGCGLVTFLTAWVSALLFAPTAVRRDVQDRSLDFWLSLPSGHALSVAAPLLAHLLLFPLAALLLGMLAGLPLSFAAVTRFVSLSDWFALPWGSIALAWVAAGLRLTLGLLLATLWLSPLILLVEAASAWLNRWGLPAVVLGIVLLGNLVQQLLGSAAVWTLLQRLLQEVERAFHAGQPLPAISAAEGSEVQALLAALPGWALADAAQALQALAQPLLLLCLAISALCFALLILRRRRGA